MKRYFEIVGQRQVVELDILDGSQAAIATVEAFSKTFKCDMRELDKAEYDRLAKEYTTTYQEMYHELGKITELPKE